MKTDDLDKLEQLASYQLNDKLGKPKTYWIGIIVCLLVAVAASIPVYGLTYLPSLDGPNHWAIVKVMTEVLRGQNPGLQFVFIPAYKLFYFSNAPLFLIAESLGFSTKSLPSVSMVFLQLLFSYLVGLKYLQLLNKIVGKTDKATYTLGIVLLLFLTLFASLSNYSGAFYWGFMPFVFSVPFVVLSIVVLEDCIYASNKLDLTVLATLLFLSYAAHPLTIYFLTLWALIRMLIFYPLEFAKGSKFSLTTLRLFGFFFLCILLLLILHYISLPGKVGLDFHNIKNSLFHPFRRFYEIYYYLKDVFTDAAGFTPVYDNKPSIYPLVGLSLILGSMILSLFIGSWRSSGFQIGLTIILFLILNASFVDDILPVYYPIGVFYRDRLTTICFPIAFTLSGYSLMVNRGIMRNKFIVAAISVIVGFGALYHITALYNDFHRFNSLSQQVYREMLAKPDWNKDYANDIYFRNRFRYRFGEHFMQYACLHEGICKGGLFYETYPDFGIYPLRPVRR